MDATYRARLLMDFNVCFDDFEGQTKFSRLIFDLLGEAKAFHTVRVSIERMYN